MIIKPRDVEHLKHNRFSHAVQRTRADGGKEIIALFCTYEHARNFAAWIGGHHAHVLAVTIEEEPNND